MPIFDNELLNNVSSRNYDNGIDRPLGSADIGEVDVNLDMSTGASSGFGVSFQDLAKLGQAPTSTGFDAPFQMIPRSELMANQRYPLYERGVNLENIYGLQQSGLAQLGNGLVKMGAFALGTFGQSFATIPNTFSALKNGKFSDLSNPNGYEASIDGWMKNVEDYFPNYVTRYEQSRGLATAIPFTYGSANFWGDKILKNSGFMVGAIAGAVVQDVAIGAITEGIGTIPLVAAQLGKASLYLNKLFSGANKVDRVLDLARTAGKSEQTLLNIERLAQLSAATKLNSGFRYGMSIYGSARTEAAIEARESYRTIKEQLTEQYKLDNYGEEPTPEAIQQIEDYATDAMNTRFGVNMALLTVSNAVQFDNLFKSFTGAQKGITSSTLKDFGSAGKVGLKEGTLDTFERKLPQTFSGKAWEFAKPKAINIFTEGVYEEGGQFATQVGVEDYYTRKYKAQGKESWDFVKEAMASTTKGMAEQFGSSEGIESMVIGAITAAITGPVVDRITGKSKADNQRLNSTINILNQYGMTGVLSNKYEDTSRSVEIAKQMNEAVNSGNIFKFKNLKADMFFGFVNSRIPIGMHDVTIEQLQMLKDLPKEEFEKTFGMDFSSSNKTTVNQYVDALIQKANNINDITTSLNSTFKNPYNRIIDPKTDDERAEALKYSMFENWKTDLARFSYMQQDSNQRIAEIQTSISQVNPLLTNDLLMLASSEKGLKELSDSYEQKANMLSESLANLSPAERTAKREEIKKLRTLSEKISIALNSNKIDTKLFNELINFELNNQDFSKPNSLRIDETSNLGTYAEDLNKIVARREQASTQFEDLSTEKGFDKYFKQEEELQKEKEEEGQTSLFPQDEKFGFLNKSGKKETAEVGREYQVPGFSPAKVRKVGEQFKVTSPTGEVKYYDTREEAKQAADDLNVDLSELTTVKVIGLNDDGTIKVEDLAGNIQNINPSSLKGYEKLQTEEEKLAKDKETLDKQQDKLEQDSATVVTINPKEGDFVGSEEQRKDASILYLSTSTPSEDTAGEVKNKLPHIVRARKFLNNLKFFNNKDKYKVILVTPNNAKELGLEGIVQLSYEKNITDPLTADQTNVESGFMAQVFILQTPEGDFFVNEKGEALSKVGDKNPTILDNVIFETMTSAKPFTEGGYVKVRAGQEEAAERALEAYKIFRAEVFKQKGYTPYSFDISRGIPRQNKINGVRENNNVGVILGDNAEDIIANTEGLIQVVTTGKVQHKTELLSFPVGTTLIQYGDLLDFVNNKKLTNSQANTVFSLIETIAKEMIMQSNTGKPVKINYAYSNFLQNILYWRSKGDTKTPSQIGIDTTNMTFNVGGKAFPLSKVSENKQEIMDVLQNAFITVNNTTLKLGPSKKFTEYRADKDGNITKVEWPNYQSYLLSGKNPDGSKRSTEETPLITHTAAPTETQASYKQKYSYITDGNVLPYDKIPPKPAPAPAQPSAPGGVMIDEYELNTGKEQKFPLNAGTVLFTGNISPDGIITVDVKSNETITKLSTEPQLVAAIDANLRALPENIVTIDLDNSTNEDKAKLFVKIKIEGELGQKLEQQASKPAPTPTQPAPVSTDAKTQVEKAQRQLDNVESKINPNAKHPLFNVGQKHNIGNNYYVQEFKDERKDTTQKGVGVITKIISPAEVDADGKMTKGAKVEVSIFDSYEQGQEFVNAQYNKYKTIGEENLAKAKAELAAQSKPTDAKAEIEIRINDTISKIFGSESLFNFDTNQPGKVINNEFIPDNLGSQLFNAINKTLKGEVVQTNKAEAEKLFKEYAKTVHPDKNQSEQANVIAEAFFKAMSTAKEQGRVDILNELKTKFDAELAALEGAKPAEEAPVDLSQIKKDDSDANEYRMVGVADEERMTNAELEIFKQWHAEKVPFIPFEVLERMVEMNDNEEAWGVFENGVAKFVRGGLRGTEYHEIGHGIWKLLSPEEQQAILADERSKPGTFKDRASGKTYSYNDPTVTDKMLEERIWDDFSDYRLGKLPARSLGERIRRLFKMVMDFFKSFVTKPSLKDELFEAIEAGRFKKAKIAAPKVKEGVKELFDSNPELASIGTPGQYSQYLDTIFPNSQVKDIVYRGGEKEDSRLFQYFTKNSSEAYMYSKANITKGGNITERNPISAINKQAESYLDNKYGKGTYEILSLPDDWESLIYYSLDISLVDIDYNLTEKGKKLFDELKEKNNKKEQLVKTLDKKDVELLNSINTVTNLYDSIKIESEGDLTKPYADVDYQNNIGKYNKARKYIDDVLGVATIRQDVGKITANVINITNPYKDEIAQEDLTNDRDAYKSGHDGAFLMDGDHFLVKSNTNQIQELGSKQDLEGFKSFVKNSPKEYRARTIQGLTEQQTNNYVQDMVAQIKLIIFQEGRKDLLFNPEKMSGADVLNILKGKYEKKGHIAAIGENRYNQLVKRATEYLKTIGVTINADEVVSINDDERTGKEYAQDPFSTDWKKYSTGALKFLLSTLTERSPLNQTNVQVGTKLNPAKEVKSEQVDGLKLLNFNRVFVTLMDRLHNTNDVDVFIEKLVQLAKEDSNYLPLFRALGGNLETHTIDFGNQEFKESDWRLFIQFFNTFSRQKPEAVIQYTSEDLKVYSGPANIFTMINQTVDSWVDNMKVIGKGAGGIISYARQNEVYRINTAELAKLPIKKSLDQLNFLAKIGVEFPIGTYEALSNRQRIIKGKKSSELEQFTDAVNKIYTQLGKNNELMTVDAKKLDINGPLRTLAELYVKVNNPNQDSTYFGVEGQRISSFAENDAPSYFQNDFNESKTLDELLEKRPELKDVFSRGSQVLKKGGLFFDKDGNRIAEINVEYIQGSKNLFTGKNKTTAKLELGDRFIQEMNQNINGKYYVLIPGDSSTEWMMNLGNVISMEDVLDGSYWNKVYNIYNAYLEDEINLALEDRKQNKNVKSKAQELRFMKDLLPSKIVEKIEKMIEDDSTFADIEKYISNNRDEINASIKSTLESISEDTFNILLNNRKIIEVGENNYTFVGLDTEFLNKYRLTGNLSKEQVMEIINFLNLNYEINNIEYHKFIFGDPYQFKTEKGKLDETKRIKSFLSPRRRTFDHPEFNNFLKRTYNSVDGIALDNKTPGYHSYKSYANTATFNDVEIVGSIATLPNVPQEIKDVYAKVNETDGMSWLMDNTHKEIALKEGQWSDEAEAFHQWHMAYTRRAFDKKGIKKYDNEALRKHDDALLSKDMPKYKLAVRKPIVSGNKANKKEIDLVLDKTSQIPLYYHMVEGTALENMYLKMFDQEIGYGIVTSGRKVGIETPHSIYNAEGKLNEAPIENIIEVPWSAYGTQVETMSEGEKTQTRGSQLTKISSMDLYNNGEPISPEAKEAYEENTKFLNLLNENAYNTLLERLGVTDLDGEFVMEDGIAVSATLMGEMLRRELSENAKDTIELDPETQQFLIPFEASPSYLQIKSILYSLVNNALVSPKMNGAPHVQVPVTMFEKATKGRDLVRKIDGEWKKITRKEYDALTEEEKKGVILTDSTLKFYTPESPYCEVMLPAWFKKQLKIGKFKDYTDDQLIDYLNNTPDGKKILSGIGFRIPTDALNKVEVFRVKEFLPEYMGYTVVVPSEITTKAGSDFDIDKLNIYLKSIYLDENENIKLVSYKGSEQATKDFYAEVWTRTREKEIQNIQDKDAFREDLYKLFSTLEGLIIPLTKEQQAFYNRHFNIINDIIDQADEKDMIPSEYVLNQISKLAIKESEITSALLSGLGKEEYAKKMYKKALENEYYASLEKLLTLKENFNRLINPTDDAGLEKMSEVLDEARGYNETGIKARLINRNYMTNMRHAFITGKRWVGIAAVNITNLSLRQKSKVYLDDSKIPLLDKKERSFVKNLDIILPHNTVDVNGRKYVSLSGTMTEDGTQLISQRLSGYATAFVDIANNPFISKIIKSDVIVSTFMFLESIGAGNTGIYFLNQPIIDKYLEYLDSKGSKNVMNNDDLNYIKSLFPTTEKQLKETQISVDGLLGNIEEYGEKGKFDQKKNAEQQLILDEFIKYKILADQLFAYTQALNYDTTRFGSSDTYLKKDWGTMNAANYNLISNVEDVLGKTFIGKLSELLSNSYQALGAVMVTENPKIKAYTLSTLKRYATKKYMSLSDYEKISNLIKNSFIDFVIQNNTTVREMIKPLLVDSQTAIVDQLEKAKQKYPSNQLLQDLVPVLGNREKSAKSITLKANIKDANSENFYTGMMRELRDSGEKDLQDLYKNIINVSILQGTGQSAISIRNIIPLEDYADKIAPIFQQLQADSMLEPFENALFERNNFKNSEIFEDFKPIIWEPKPNPQTGIYEEKQYMFDPITGENKLIHVFPNYSITGFGESRTLIKLSEQYNSFQLSSDFIKVPKVISDKKGNKFNVTTGTEISKADYAYMMKKGDFNLFDAYYYKKVYTTLKDEFGNPIPLSTYTNAKVGREYYYKLINVYGDGDRAVEMNTNFTPSVIDNGSMRIANETSDEQIVSMINPGIEKQVVSLPTQRTDMANLQSGKEEFDKLPSKSATPTMTYAGIGSRETPKEVMDQMTELAKELESRGYTLRSGGAQGADTAFEKGVTSKKEIFPGAQKSGEREMKIAREIHPNPNALDNSKNPAFVWNLMARNTNQVFGKNLDTPVDFVIAYTQDGLTDYTKRSIKSGGTGQAIDMASRKGIPVINLANSNWRQELDRVLSTPTQSIATPVSNTNKPKGVKVKDGIYVNQEALTKEEQLELFDYLKPFLEEQAAKTNKGTDASKMIGLGLRWDYRSNNPGKQSKNIPDVINPGNKTKYGYYDTSINNQPLGAITPRFRELMQKATGVDMTNYDGAIINLYEPTTFISSHNDVDESRSAIGYPVIGINLGGTGNFSIESRDGAPKQLNLKPGAGYVFGVDGVNREVYHRTFAKPQDSFLPELTTKIDGKTYEPGSYRVTVTMRRVMPLEPGMPSKPAITSLPKEVAQPGEQLGLFEDKLTLKDGKEYSKSDINSNMLEALGYTPKEIGKILKSIC